MRRRCPRVPLLLLYAARGFRTQNGNQTQKIKKQETMIVATPPAIAPRISGCRSFRLLLEFVELEASVLTGASSWPDGDQEGFFDGCVDGYLRRV